jgi:hypothetical protein
MIGKTQIGANLRREQNSGRKKVDREFYPEEEAASNFIAWISRTSRNTLLIPQDHPINRRLN